jgi:aryl-alcohol dehydrogenase-like predicted oxidoreductase
LRVPAGSKGHLSLRELADAATEVGGTSHHFRTVQLPLNLAMTEAVRVPTQMTARGSLVSVVEAATELGISVVASASLMQAQLATGLPDALRETFPALHTDAQRAIAFVRALPIAAALVGMKNAAHVDENIEAGQA